MRYFALLLVLPTLVVQAATTTSAEAAVINGFEIDGNLTDDAGAGIDWNSPGVPAPATDPVGEGDDTNFQGTSKEFDNPSTWVRAEGVAPGQDDVAKVYSYATMDSLGTVWAYFGFLRDSTNGTTNYSVEYNRLPSLAGTATTPPVPQRSVNDILVRVEQKGSDQFTVSGVMVFTNEGGPGWNGDCIEVGTTGAGWCPRSLAPGAFAGATGEGGSFAEGALRISDYFSTTDPCGGGFGTLNIRSYTGNDDQSALKDYVEPLSVAVPGRCGQLQFKKFDQFGTAVGGATFLIMPDPTPGSAAASLTVVDGGLNDPDGMANGLVTLNPAKNATYEITETTGPAGYQLDTRTLTVTVTSTGQTPAPEDAWFENKLEFKPLTVSNEASGSYGVEYDWAVHKTVVGASKKTIDEGATTTFQYKVELEALPEGPPTGKEVHGTMTVTNPNPADYPAMRATLSLSGDLPCAFLPSNAAVDVDGATAGVQVDVAPGSTPYDYECEPGGGLLETGTIRATATWAQARYPQDAAHPGSAFDDATYEITVQPKIDEFASVTDSFNGGPAVKIGKETPYKWSEVWGATNNRVEVATYSSIPVGGTAGTCSQYENVARVDENNTEDFDTSEQTVEVCVDLDDLVVTKTANPKFSRDYDWSIEKSVKGEPSQTVPEGTPASFEYDVVVTPSDGKDSSFVVKGVITVNNPNATTISGVSLSDELPGATCTIDKPAGALTIPKGESTFGYSCVLPNATATTTGTNTATATWDAATYFGTDGSASGTKSFDFADAVRDVTDETATVTDTQIDLNDEVPGGVVLQAAAGPRTFTYTKEFDGVPGECNSYDNTAKVVEDDSKEFDDDTATVEVCVEKPLEPEVSGSADLARAYAWSIAKVADATQRTVDGSGNATFTYTVTASAGSATDSGWQVTGSVKITNPNTYAAGDITADVTAATTLGGGSACTVTGGNDVEIPASDDGVGSVTLPIACTFGSQPSGTGALSVTATWDPAGEATTTSVTDSTPISFAVRSETNKTVQVVDDKTVAGQRVVLDPALTWSAGLVKTYTYSLAVAGGAAGACRSHTNTATIDQPVGVDPTATAVVLACTPAAPPPPEVAPEQSFGKAGGSVRASCQGTVRSKLNNRSGVDVSYRLRVGKKVHKIVVKSLSAKRFTTTGKPRARVVLKAEGRTLDRVRIPNLCVAPEVLPDTGMRAAEARLGSITRRWRY